MTTPELVIIITTTGSAIVTVINAIASGWGRKSVQERADRIFDDLHRRSTTVDGQLKEIKELANGNMNELRQHLAAVQVQLDEVRSERDVLKATRRHSDHHKDHP